MSRSVPAARTGDVDPDGYAGMPIVIEESPEYRNFMAPETAPFGTWLQGWYRVTLGLALRTIGFALWQIGEIILRVTQYWYYVAMIIASLVTVLIIFVTR